MSIDIISVTNRASFHITRPWDTILQEPAKATTSNRHLYLPPPTFRQQDIEVSGPTKVTKSNDHIREIISLSFCTNNSELPTETSASSFNKHFKHLFPMDVAIRCTTPNCSCDCFAPGKTQLRICQTCNHGWITHAMAKISFKHLIENHCTVENIQSNAAFDLASLILYGTHALPVRLKILLDRVLCTLQHSELLHLLHGFGWTYEDYSRGYMLQDTSGNVLSKWSIVSKEEEIIIVQHFLKFIETKNIAQNFLLSEPLALEQFNFNFNSSICSAAKKDSDIKKFIEISNKGSNCSNVKSSSNYKTHQTNSLQISSNTTSNKSVRSQQSILQPNSPNNTNRNTQSSPTNCRSPSSSLSPLNKLQNMQMHSFDMRKSDSLPTSIHDIPISLSQCSTSLASNLFNTNTNLQFLSSGQNLTNSTPTTNHVSSLSNTMTTTSTTNSDFSATENDSDDDTNLSGAINLSQTSSAYALKKVKHLRKSANPMKRKWNPMVLSGLVTNPSTGKKRVQCHVCMKTFCDKGALKIHFSAVHLREMHKCTVEGCNMMFSSRRSRNRHSANPNPKLHTPNFRRKVNPHDGRSSNPFPTLSPSTASTILNLTNNNFLSQSMSSGGTDSEQIHEFGQLASSSSVKSGFDHEKENASSNSSNSFMNCNIEGESLSSSASPNKKQKINDKDSNNELDLSVKNGPAEEGMNLSTKDEQINNNKSERRKRKSLNPIKCAPITMHASDDEMRYISSDDSSSDTYIDRVDDDNDNGILEDSKSEDDESIDGCAIDFKTELTSSYLKEKNKKNDNRIKRETIEYEHDGTIDLSKKRSLTPEKKQETKSEIPLASKNSNESTMENPLRHLESLSLGAFTGLVSSRNQRANLFGSSSSHPLSFQPPGLGLCLKSPTTPPTQISQQTSERENCLITKESETTVNSVTTQSNMVPSGMDIDPKDPTSMLPVFRDSPFVGQIDVPVDKENPRRCTACGKIFQNHFGVKTHYQNVHLKLMHKCTVEGCNASFPSKRSRDRHSANLNLHRKLLSTHSDTKQSFGMEKAASNALFPFHPGASLRDDWFSRLYDPQGLPLSLSELYSKLPPLGPDGLFAASAAAAAAASYPVVPGFHPAMCLPPPPPPILSNSSANSLFLDNRTNIGRDTPSSIGTTPSPSPSNRSSPHKVQQTNSPKHSIVLEASLNPNEEGKYICAFCQKSYSNGANMKEHYETTHTDALYKCCIQGCNKAFLTKKSKKYHIQNSPSHRQNSP